MDKRIRFALYIAFGLLLPAALMPIARHLEWLSSHKGIILPSALFAAGVDWFFGLYIGFHRVLMQIGNPGKWRMHGGLFALAAALFALGLIVRVPLFAWLYDSALSPVYALRPYSWIWLLMGGFLMMSSLEKRTPEAACAQPTPSQSEE